MPYRWKNGPNPQTDFKNKIDIALIQPNIHLSQKWKPGAIRQNIESLLNRLDSISEIIIATDASLEGDATALYLSNLLKDYSVKVTRLARGLPIGGTLEHVDQTTLSRSIEDRVELK